MMVAEVLSHVFLFAFKFRLRRHMVGSSIG